MQHLKHLLTQPLSHTPKWVVGFLIVIAALGFADATYLTVEHYTNANPPCFVGSCELVLTSAYSTVFGIPVAIFGAVYYLFILICFFTFIEAKKEKALRIGLCVTVIGFLTSLYFFGVQAFALHAFCQYCLGSALSSTILFVTAITIFVKSMKRSS